MGSGGRMMKRWYHLEDGVDLADHVITDLMDILPTLEARVRIPSSENYQVPEHTHEIFDAVTILNDIHGWTREQIADWLDTLDIDLTVVV
jgi:hypothetical protein